MRIIFLLIVPFSICQAGICQIERPNKAYGEFTAEVTRSDSVGYIYDYTIKNAEESEQVLVAFSIFIKDKSFYNKTIPSPSTKKWYIDGLDKIYITGAAAGKILDLPPENGLSPGEQIEISFNSEGLPAIHPFYTEGFVEPLTDEYIDSLFKAGYTEDEIFIDWKEAAYKGDTISPRVWSENVDMGVFLDSLNSYLVFSCDTTWVTNKGICRSLQAKLDNVDKQLSKDKTKQAINGLNAFLNEVRAQQGKHITSEGYALLWFNGLELLEQLGGERTGGGKGGKKDKDDKKGGKGKKGNKGKGEMRDVRR
ncbi:hypothetical protein LX73_1070 [Fodinibius salinus]|uniref:FIMAH domain-containing protein n=1 Tax=Fodinibius salinus TaxID=860790 RepID=A0A5D3YIP5_9BACT|nr:hypothetical protein [Fodinibius salinus]TYP93368.1 hypothetical protein LX73_1070 [Fodinibius salinus]